MVILRFLAERFGLAGSNDIENAEIAGILDVLKDFRLKMHKVIFSDETDEGRKAEVKKKLLEEKYWGILEGMIKKNSSRWLYLWDKANVC